MTDSLETAFDKLALECTSDSGESTDTSHTRAASSDTQNSSITSETTAIKYHPAYGQDLPNAITLQSVEEIHFRVPMDTLSARCPVFGDMFSIPSSVDADIVIPLMTATSAGLACFLDLLLEKNVNLVDLLLGMENATDLASLLDVEHLTKRLWNHYIEAKEYFSAFAIAVFANDIEEAKVMSGKSLLLDFNDFPSDVLEMMATHHPDYLRRLEQLHRETRPLIGQLRFGFNDLPAYNGFDDFGKECRRKSCWAYSEYSCFDAARAAAAEAAYQYFVGSSFPTSSYGVRVGIESTIKCTRCTTRLQRTFYPAFRMMGISSWTI